MYPTVFHKTKKVHLVTISRTLLM